MPAVHINRGLKDFVSITDSYGMTVTVRQSSSAEGPHCWVFCKDRDGNDAIIHLGRPTARSPHLTPAMARKVAAALITFADEAER